MRRGAAGRPSLPSPRGTLTPPSDGASLSSNSCALRRASTCGPCSCRHRDRTRRRCRRRGHGHDRRRRRDGAAEPPVRAGCAAGTLEAAARAAGTTGAAGTLLERARRARPALAGPPGRGALAGRAGARSSRDAESPPRDLPRRALHALRCSRTGCCPDAGRRGAACPGCCANGLLPGRGAPGTRDAASRRSGRCGTRLAGCRRGALAARKPAASRCGSLALGNGSGSRRRRSSRRSCRGPARAPVAAGGGPRSGGLRGGRRAAGGRA